MLPEWRRQNDWENLPKFIATLQNWDAFKKLSKNGFPNWTKGKKVGIGEEKTSRMIVKEKLSGRAVMKENGLGRVYLQEEEGHQKNLVRATTKSRAGHRQSLMDMSVKERGIDMFWRVFATSETLSSE